MSQPATPQRALKLIEKEKKERTGVLDLLNCGLHFIPEEVRDMTWLTVLGVSGTSKWSEEYNEWEDRFSHIEVTNNLIRLPEWLSSLKKLEHISLSGSELNSLEYLSNLNNLKSLQIDGARTKIYDLSPLLELNKLTHLKLYCIDQINLSSLSSLRSLTNLALDCKSCSNLNDLQLVKSLTIFAHDQAQIEMVGELKQLQKLSLRGSQFDSIHIVENMTELLTLNIISTKVSDLRALSTAQSLESLSCIGSYVNNLEPLSDLGNLKRLDIDGTQVKKLNPLSALSTLELLDFRNTKINDLSPIVSLSNLQDLCFGNTQVSDLTPLSNLSKLQHLNFYNTQVSDLSPISMLVNLKTLSFQDTKVLNIKPISGLSSLQELYCYSTNISELSPLSNLNNLKTLYLDKTKVTSLNPISNLLNLQILSCNRTGIRDLSPISGLSKLKMLGCSENNIKDLKPLGDLPKLEFLNIQETKVSDLSPISNFSKLQSLYCDNTDVSNLCPITRLPNIQDISCDDSAISTLNPLSNLKKLRSISFRNTKVSDLTPLSKLPNLERIYCDNTEVEDLSPISNAPNLIGLACANSKVSSLDPISELCSLESINCDNTQVSDLTSVSSSPSLRSLSCESTQITNLNPIKNFLRSEFSHFECKGSPLLVPPVEFASSSKQAIVEYYDELEEGHNPLNEVKVIFLGEGASGKTSLIKRLRNEEFDEEESQTHGIRIRQTPYEIEKETIMANLWDFGGQEVMHATHQFFLSQRCIYVLVLNSRTDDKAEYWLKHANSFGGHSPVLVVLNKIDENPSFQVNSKVLNEKYPQIKGYHRLSCKTDEGIDELKEALTHQISLSDARRTPFPDTWRGVKDCFVTLDEDYIDSSLFREICLSNRVEKPFSQGVLLQFLHDLGIVINFKRLKNFDTQILNPLWLTSGVYRVINSPLIADQNGLFEEFDFDNIINDPRYAAGNTTEKVYHYPVNKLHYIIRVMQEFELCFQLDTCRYIIPQLLPVEEPDTNLDGATINFVINFPEFLPDSIFPRLMVKLHELIAENLRWRSGMVLRAPLLFGNTSARVRSDKEDKRITIDACGEEPRRLLSYIRETLKEIIKAFADLQYEEMLRIPDTEVFLGYNELVDLEAMKVDQYPVGRLKKTVSVSGLLNGIEEASMRDDDAKAEVKAFLSYAHIDLKEKDKLRAALSPLERLHKLSIWDDHAIDGGAEWEKEIFDQLDKAEIVLCLISPDFINSDFCHQRELTQALEAHSRDEKIVVPIQLRESDWDELPISRLQGIPGDWILSVKNHDKARAKVSKKLRKTIEQVKSKRKNPMHPF